MSRSIRAKFMMIVAIIFAVYSVLWGLAPYEKINFSARFILDLADWPLDNFLDPLDKNTKFLSAIGAGLLCAISIFLGGIVVPAIREENKPIIHTTIFAMSAWYIIDSVGSVASGVTSNVFFNSIYLGLVLTPLLWKDREEERSA